MTRDQKQALKGLLALIAFKAVLYVSINQAAKYIREMNAKYETDSVGLKGQFAVQNGTGIIDDHARFHPMN